MVSDELHYYTKTGTVQSSDDIVTRLRELREVLMGNPIMAREVQEAMDEIERLRAEVDNLLGKLRNTDRDEWLMWLFREPEVRGE